ncbi:MAG: lysine transporter LysE [Flavobacteriaceae bacterium]|nr:lysine transporter LysE [Flavobacteriaceae bacterium]|tara:strand:- start:21324 stop:21926 length:603 start_codon:yes stop_codon:yes gene_type:complete
MQIDVLFAFLTSVFFLTLSPGPDIMYVFYKSSTCGFKEAAKLSMGLTSGLLIHTLFVAFGISTLIKSNQDYFDLIKYFGFIYFTYLGFSQFFKKNIGVEKKNESNNSFVTGLLMNLLNPKVSIFFIAFLPAFVFHNSLDIELQFIILGLIFWAVATLIFVFISLVSSNFKTLFEKYINYKKIKYIQALIFLLIALYILLI